MQLSPAFLFCLAVIASSNAEAFSYSSGWTPGATTKSTPSAIPTSSFKHGTPPGRQFSWSSLLTSGPIGGLLSRSGFNISEKLEEARRRAADLPWDDRIPMIRDDNFEELIFNEDFTTLEEEEKRTWFLLVTVTATQRTGVSAIVDKEFNEAYNISIHEQDLPNIRWGRIDYVNVTRLTTKWAVWRAPMLIVARDRGKTLRFFYPQQLGVKAPRLRDFLQREAWTVQEPWTGPWAPGGSREWLLNKFSIFQEKLYCYLTKIPRWMYLVFSGTIGSFLIQLFHRKPAAARSKVGKPTPTAASAVEQQVDSVVRADPASVSGGTKEARSRKRKGKE